MVTNKTSLYIKTVTRRTLMWVFDFIVCLYHLMPGKNKISNYFYVFFAMLTVDKYKLFDIKWLKNVKNM